MYDPDQDSTICKIEFRDTSRPGRLSVIERRYPHAWQSSLNPDYEWCSRCGDLRNSDGTLLVDHKAIHRQAEKYKQGILALAEQQNPSLGKRIWARVRRK